MSKSVKNRNLFLQIYGNPFSHLAFLLVQTFTKFFFLFPLRENTQGCHLVNIMSFQFHINSKQMILYRIGATLLRPSIVFDCSCVRSASPEKNQILLHLFLYPYDPSSLSNTNSTYSTYILYTASI